ncbi:MAG: TPM domain-containing protein [Sediminibacterium sp.]
MEFFFEEQFSIQVEKAIEEAELLTSAEFKLHIEESCNEDLLDRAAFVFSELELHKTEKRNAVLLYVSVNDRKVSILADAGANTHLSEELLSEILSTLINDFKLNQYAQGIGNCFLSIASALKSHFPYQENDINEISNTVSR